MWVLRSIIYGIVTAAFAGGDRENRGEGVSAFAAARRAENSGMTCMGIGGLNRTAAAASSASGGRRQAASRKKALAWRGTQCGGAQTPGVARSALKRRGGLPHIGEGM